MKITFYKKYLLYITLFFCFLPSFLLGSENSGESSESNLVEEKISNMTLKEIEEYATENNPLYLQEKTNIGMARGDAITASLYYNPTLAVQHQFIGASKSSGPGLPETYISFQQALDSNGVIGQRKKIAAQDLQVSLHQFSDFDRIFRLRLRQNYWSYLFLTEMMRFQAEFLKNYNDLQELTKFRAEKGDISWLEYERIELERIQLEREYENSKINRSHVGKQLRILIGIRNPITAISFKGRLDFFTTEELGINLEHFDVESRSDFTALKHLENRERLNIELKKREAIPILTIGGELMNKGIESYSGVFASIPLPIFDRKQGEILKAEEKAKNARLGVESKKIEIESEVYNLKTELIIREQQLLNYKKIKLLEKNKEVEEKSRFAYVRGASNLVTFLEAERNYLNVLRTYYELIYLYYNAIDQYRAAVGLINPTDYKNLSNTGKSK